MLKKLLLLAVFMAGPWSVAVASCSIARPELFDTFFRRFSDDRAYAVERTILPLQMWRWIPGLEDNGKDDSHLKKSLLDRKDYQAWPALTEHMAKNGLRAKVTSRKSTAVVVEVFLPESDWLVSWHFKTRSGCWYFWLHEDHSL